jgi:precorrin-2 methylase
LPEIVALLEERGLASRSVFVARAGLDGERIETDLAKFKGEGEQLGYLSVILIPAHRKASA